MIDHGRSGFLVTSIDEAVDAVRLASELPRQTVRSCFEEGFTARRMAEDYLRLVTGSTMQDRTQFREPFMLAS